MRNKAAILAIITAAALMAGCASPKTSEGEKTDTSTESSVSVSAVSASSGGEEQNEVTAESSESVSSDSVKEDESSGAAEKEEADAKEQGIWISADATNGTLDVSRSFDPATGVLKMIVNEGSADAVSVYDHFLLVDNAKTSNDKLRAIANVDYLYDSEYEALDFLLSEAIGNGTVKSIEVEMNGGGDNGKTAVYTFETGAAGQITGYTRSLRYGQNYVSTIIGTHPETMPADIHVTYEYDGKGNILSIKPDSTEFSEDDVMGFYEYKLPSDTITFDYDENAELTGMHTSASYVQGTYEGTDYTFIYKDTKLIDLQKSVRETAEDTDTMKVTSTLDGEGRITSCVTSYSDNAYANTRNFAYDEHGNFVSTVNGAGTEQALTLTYSYQKLETK